MKNLFKTLSSITPLILLLFLSLLPPAQAEISVSQSTGVPTEGWDGPGLGSAVIPWYLGWDNACAAGDRGVTNDGLLTRANVEAAITAAMNTWSEVADIEFVKVGDSSLPGGGCIGDAAADTWNCDGDATTYQVNILWGSGDHCDGFDFDGPWNPTTNTGSVFGHSWGPPDIWDWIANTAFIGNVHLDEGDNWVTGGATDVGGPGSGLTSVFIDIQSEVLHELGHSIGLAHSPYGTDSIMEPLSWNLEDRVLSAYDITEIQKLYAVPSDKPGVVLLFDLSGSMGWDADGNRGVPLEQQRLSLAKRAARPFIELLNTYGADVAEFAIAGFTSANGGCNGETHSDMTVINAASLQAAISETPPGSIESMNPAGSTPLLAGIQHARSLFTDHDNKAIVLLSDGYHNCPSQVSVGDAELTALIANLNTNDIAVNTIGFGRPGDFDHPLLETLAADTHAGGTSGNFYDVTVAGFDIATFDQATELQSAYKDILTHHLGLETALDPLGIATMGSVKTHKVKISPLDRKVSFFVSWKTPEANRLKLELLSSDNHPVLENVAGVDIRRGQSYTIVTIDETFLNQSGKVGTMPWTLNITANNLKKGEKEHFQYSVVMDSELKMKAMLETEEWGTGSKVKVRASIREKNRPVTGLLHVYLDTLRPSQGIGSWYAKNILTKNDMKKLAEVTRKDPLSPLARKALYLQENMGVKFPTLNVLPTKQLFDDGTHGDRTANDGIYTNIFDDTVIDGAYTWRVRASGNLPAGGVFERETLVKKHIPAVPDSENSKVSVARLADKQIAITFVPRDALGNYIGPGYTGTLDYTVANATSVSDIQDNLDGSYTQVFKLADSAPEAVAIKISIGDKTKSVSWISDAGQAVSNTIVWILTLLIILLLITVIILLNRRP